MYGGTSREHNWCQDQWVAKKKLLLTFVLLLKALLHFFQWRRHASGVWPLVWPSRLKRWWMCGLEPLNMPVNDSHFVELPKRRSSITSVQPIHIRSTGHSIFNFECHGNFIFLVKNSGSNLVVSTRFHCYYRSSLHFRFCKRLPFYPLNSQFYPTNQEVLSC